MNLKFILKIIILFSAFGNILAQNEGLEIYLIDVENPMFKAKNTQNCLCCMTVNPGDILGEPLVAKDDIASFDWENQVIYINESGQKKLSKFDFMKPGRLPGVPAAITLYKIPIYSFIMFPPNSSNGCDRVHTMLEPGKFVMRFGSRRGKMGEWKYGTDPRFDGRLKFYLDNQ